MASNYISIFIVVIGFIFLTAMVLTDGVRVVKRWEFYFWVFAVPMNVYMLAVSWGKIAS